MKTDAASGGTRLERIDQGEPTGRLEYKMISELIHLSRTDVVESPELRAESLIIRGRGNPTPFVRSSFSDTTIAPFPGDFPFVFFRVHWWFN